MTPSPHPAPNYFPKEKSRLHQGNEFVEKDYSSTQEEEKNVYNNKAQLQKLFQKNQKMNRWIEQDIKV